MKLYELGADLVLFRVADTSNPIMSSYGASILGGRWNSPGTEVIYACCSYEGCILESLVRLNAKKVPSTHGWVRIVVPRGTVACEFEAGDIRNWSRSMRATRKYGDHWALSLASSVLIAPGFVARPHQRNAVLLPVHTDYKGIQVSRTSPVKWDQRLF